MTQKHNNYKQGSKNSELGFYCKTATVTWRNSEYVTKTKTAVVMSRSCVTDAATVHQRYREEPEQKITPSETSPTREATSHPGGWLIEHQSYLHAVSDLTGSGVHKETGLAYHFKKMSSRWLTTWSKDRKQRQQPVLSDSVIPSSLCHLLLALMLLPSPIGHLAHLVLQVCSADVRQAIIQRTTLYQTVHWRWRDYRLLLLHHIP